jgi:hypothetical protein
VKQKKIDDNKEIYHATVHKKKRKRYTGVKGTIIKHSKKEKKRIKATHTHTHTNERARYRLGSFFLSWIHSGIEET